MKLIEYDNYEVKVTDEAFHIVYIRDLFEQDKSKRKDNFFKQLSYMYFMVDPRSDYMYITDEKERATEIKKQEGFSEDWEPSALLLKAIEAYKAHVITTESLLLQDMRIGIDNLRRFLREVDLTTTDKNGKPIYQVSSITSALKQIPELVKTLNDAEKALANSYADEEKQARGSREKALYEDDDDDD